jgi:O-acetyl-ADP-ribose deacetylase (regulator of RNase III)
MRELDEVRAASGGCPTGGAVVTTAGTLPATYVFHAVGPVYRDGRHGEPALLASCYETALKLAHERQVKVISFPSISTGVYRYPVGDAARIALRAVVEHLERPDTSVQEAVFVLFDRATYDAYARALVELSREPIE